MEKLIYLDTNIYIDYFKNRTDYSRPLGEFAFQLLRRTFGCEFKIVISSLVLTELERNGCSKQGLDLVESLSKANKIVKVEIVDKDVDIARNISRKRETHYSDVLHAVIANRAGAEYLITRNVEDFARLNDFANIRYPEGL